MYSLEVAPARTTALVLALALGFTSWLAVPADHAERRRVVVTETETTILDVVKFVPGTATLCDSSKATLDAVAQTLRGNPSIQLVEVQSHTSGVGDRAANQTLSSRRAAVVVKYLEAAGIEPSRLVAEGYGDTQPIDGDAPAKNERVAFLILKRATDLDAD
jgi:outer membrane protein OmpA-like peptidoglycan-associated protein